MGSEALNGKAAEVDSSIFLVVQWDQTDTSSFVENGPRDELVMMLERLADDLSARVSIPGMQEKIPIVDTNGQPVGVGFLTAAPPASPTDGHPLLVVPVFDLERTALVVTDVATKLQSCVEDMHVPCLDEEARVARLQWRDLPSLERQWFRRQGDSWDVVQAAHKRVHEQLRGQDRINLDARFARTYERVERIAESLGLHARLQGFGDCARVGYFKDGQWTGIASEITLGGKVLTTVNAKRASGTGYTADGEWQRDQLESALNLWTNGLEMSPTHDAYAQAADLYEPDAL